MDFPVEFPCHHCGCNETIINNVKKELVERGKFNESTPVGSMQRMVGVFDPLKPGLTCPMILILWDICAKCGTEYIWRVDRKEGQVGMIAPTDQRYRKINPFDFPRT